MIAWSDREKQKNWWIDYDDTYDNSIWIALLLLVNENGMLFSADSNMGVC